MHPLVVPFTRRYITFTAAILATVVCLALSFLFAIFLLPFALGLILVAVGVRDLMQPHHSILRSYPIAAHLRFLFEDMRPEIRQYFLESDTDGKPFDRDARSIVYQRAKGQLDKRPFGTQLDVYATAFEWLNHSIAPKDAAKEPFRITIGGAQCKRPYSASVLSISARTVAISSGRLAAAISAAVIPMAPSRPSVSPSRPRKRR